VSIADELEKLANLRDRGILTEEEFDTQKSLALGTSSHPEPSYLQDSDEHEESDASLDDTTTYDMSEYSFNERTALNNRLVESAVPYSWEGDSLTIYTADSALFETCLDPDFASGVEPWPDDQPEWSGEFHPSERSIDGGTNGLAIASLVLGILWFGGLGAILALIFGLVSRGQIARSRHQSGNGLATAGIVLGIVGTIGAVAFWVAIGVAISSGANSYSDGYNAGQTAWQQDPGGGNATSDCEAMTIPGADSYSLFYSGCLAGWNDANNSANSG
jgi:hypothetical protein